MTKYYALFNPVYFVFLKSKNFDFENFQFNKNTLDFITDSFKNETEKENLKYELERFIQSLDEDDRWLFQTSTGEHLLVDLITEEDTQLDEFYTQMNIGVLLSASENVIQQYGVRSFLL